MDKVDEERLLVPWGDVKLLKMDDVTQEHEMFCSCIRQTSAVFRQSFSFSNRFFRRQVSYILGFAGQECRTLTEPERRECLASRLARRAVLSSSGAQWLPRRRSRPSGSCLAGHLWGLDTGKKIKPAMLSRVTLKLCKSTHHWCLVQVG